jgi:hypothetical protein
MKKRLPLLLGMLAAAIPAFWVGVLWFFRVEQIPEFILVAIERQAKDIGLLLFESREAALGIWYPLFLFYCGILGILVWFACRCLVRGNNRDAYKALQTTRLPPDELGKST